MEEEASSMKIFNFSVCYLIVLFLGCGQNQRLSPLSDQNPKDLNNVAYVTEEQSDLEFTWEFENPGLVKFQLNRFAENKEGGELLLIGAKDAGLKKNNNMFTYTITRAMRDTLKLGDCFVIRGVLLDESKTLPSDSVCMVTAK